MLPIHELLNANELHMEQLLRARLSELGLAPNVLRTEGAGHHHP